MLEHRKFPNFEVIKRKVMNRKTFLKKLALGSAAAAALPVMGNQDTPLPKDSTYERLMQRVGFNHLPPTQTPPQMKTVYHPSNSRGHANHGWLNSHHSFSFANYYNPERMHFGVLRVLNDDVVAPGKGFGTHPHDNMEIISIPLEGDLEHKDSMGNVAVIRQGDVQVMSAGTGIYHSEYNRNNHQPVKFLQIWVFPHTKNVAPRYDQIPIATLRKPNSFYQILSPSPDDQGVWIHQNAWFFMGEFDAGHEEQYRIQQGGNGAYLFVLEGSVSVGQQTLHARDGLGIWDTQTFKLSASTSARVLLMDVPMGL